MQPLGQMILLSFLGFEYYYHPNNITVHQDNSKKVLGPKTEKKLFSDKMAVKKVSNKELALIVDIFAVKFKSLENRVQDLTSKLESKDKKYEIPN